MENVSKETSRTHKGLRNTATSLSFYLLSVLITFLVRRFFLESLGEEVLGLKGVMANFLGIISLAELGIGGAISYSLYKPLLNKDYQAINEIISVQAWFYRRVALFVSFASLILLCFFPIIFSDLKAPIWYCYVTFIVFLWEAMMSYLINYRSILFTADQRSYRLTINIQGIYILKNCIQLALLYLFPKLENIYLYYLIIEVFISILGVYILEKMIQNDYPWLKPMANEGRKYLAKYKEIIKKTKQLFAHQLGAVALMQISPVLVLFYSNPKFVTYYGSYTVLTNYLTHTLQMVLGTLISGVGNLVAENNKRGIQQFFWEFLSFKHLIATISTFAFFYLSNHFIPIWLGENENYLLPELIILLLSINLYLNISRSCEVFTTAYGLFQDVWAPIAETSINVGGGLVLGYICTLFYTDLGFSSKEYAGIFGVLLGANLSILLIIFIWKPYFLFKEALQLPISQYWKNYLKYPIVSLMLIILACRLTKSLDLDFSTLPLFVLNTFLIVSSFSICSYIVFYILSKGMRDLSYRIKILLLSFVSKKH